MNNTAFTNQNTRTSTKAWAKLKTQARKRLDYSCQYCGVTDKLELDHIRNHARGGTDTLDNLQWLCPPCHWEKTKKETTIGHNAWKRKPEPHPGLKA